MSKAQREAIRDGKDDYWWRGKVICCACGHEQDSAIQIPVQWQEPAIPLECVECGGMTCNPE